MPPVYRIIEVCIYALLNFLPFMLLALYPFRKNLRFSDVTTAILTVLLTIVHMAWYLGCLFLPRKYRTDQRCQHSTLCHLLLFCSKCAGGKDTFYFTNDLKCC